MPRTAALKESAPPRPLHERHRPEKTLLYRIGDSWRATLEIQVFSNIDASDVLAFIENDDFLLVEMAYFF